MANRFIIAELFTTDPLGTPSIEIENNFIHISPWRMEITNTDNVYLIVRLGNVVTADESELFSFYILENGPFSKKSPIMGEPSTPISGTLNVPIAISPKSALNSTIINYSLVINLGGFEFKEDPKLQINS